MFKKIALLMLCLLLSTIVAFGQVSGDYTSHDLFYRPDYGASGTDEWETFNDYLEIADQQITDNKDNSFAEIDTEAELESAITDVTDFYTDNDFDIDDYLLIADEYTDTDAVTAIKADADWNATDWDTAYGWGDHSTEGYLTDITAESILDLDDTPAAFDNDKVLKSTADGTEWATDDDTTYTSSDFTHDNLTGVDADEHIDWTVSQDPTVIHSDNYTDTNTEYTAGTGLSLAAEEFSLDAELTDLTDVNTATVTNRYVLVADGVDFESRLLVEADISDLGTYLEDITGESILDLSDVAADPDADRYLMWDDSETTTIWAEGAGGGASELSDLSDVNTSTATDGNVLRADGDDWESTTLASSDLSDSDDIAMLDEHETVTGSWAFDSSVILSDNVDVYKTADTAYPLWKFYRSRDGDPTYVTQTDDVLFSLQGYGVINEDEHKREGAHLQFIQDDDVDTYVPTRIELSTSTSTSVPILRMAIDSAGNTKMGDGDWTNYVNIDDAGILSFEGDAYIDMNDQPITEANTVRFNGLYDNGNSGSAVTINWQNGQYQEVTVSENTTISFSNAFVGTITLNINYDGDYTVDFDAGDTIETEGGTAISFTETNGAFDVLKVYYYGVSDTYVVGLMADVKE